MHKTFIEKNHDRAAKGLRLTKTTVGGGVVRVRGRHGESEEDNVISSLKSDSSSSHNPCSEDKWRQVDLVDFIVFQN